MVGRDSAVGTGARYGVDGVRINPLNAELNPIWHFLALLGAHHILHVSRIKVNSRWGGARFSATVHTGPGDHPKGTGSFSGLRRPGCDAEHLPPSSAEAKKRVQVYFYPPAESSQTVLGWFINLSLRK